MGKEFVDYHSANGKIPYSASTLCFCLTQYAIEYILENRNRISNIDNKVRDAVLVDAINYLGMKGGCDFALYTKDLHGGKRHEDIVDPQALLTVILNHYAWYIFNEDMVDSVLRNNHMNECTKKFDVNDGAKVLVDFINYIAEQNDYDTIFTIAELLERFKKQKHECELNELKKFLKLTGQYYQRLLSGQNIQEMYDDMAEKHHLKDIGPDGTYHYTDEIKDRIGHSEMYAWDVEEIEKEVYAMAYAFAKVGEDKQSQVQVIDKKLFEMRKKK